MSSSRKVLSASSITFGFTGQVMIPILLIHKHKASHEFLELKCKMGLFSLGLIFRKARFLQVTGVCVFFKASYMYFLF